MEKCKELRVIPDGSTYGDLVGELFITRKDFKECGDTHNKLLDLINKRIDGK